MSLSRLTLFASLASALVSFPDQRPLTSPASTFKCDLPPVLDPAGDGLPSATDLFSSKEALKKQVERHQAVVRVPSICFDDLGDFNSDKRWKPFNKLHHVLAKTYPLV